MMRSRIFLSSVITLSQLFFWPANVIFSGTPLLPIALIKKVFAASVSLFLKATIGQDNHNLLI
jgi:hypothetical protein